MSRLENGPQLSTICWPVPKNNRGKEFSNGTEQTIAGQRSNGH